MKIVYSPMHGAGVRLVPESLKRFGFTNVHLVPEQAVIDGNFPTVESPNPEERKTMSMAIDLAKKVKADLVLATDPDSDRIGVALPDENGEYVLLNGNQTLVLLMTYQLTRWAELGRLNGHQYVIKTIVTTEMVDAVADYFKVKCYEDVYKRQSSPSSSSFLLIKSVQNLSILLVALTFSTLSRSFRSTSPAPILL